MYASYALRLRPTHSVRHLITSPVQTRQPIVSVISGKGAVARAESCDFFGYAGSPRLEIAVLKISATGLPHFDLAAAPELQTGDRVLAFSNLYGIASGSEPSSLLQGYISVIASTT